MMPLDLLAPPQRRQAELRAQPAGAKRPTQARVVRAQARAVGLAMPEVDDPGRDGNASTTIMDRVSIRCLSTSRRPPA